MFHKHRVVPEEASVHYTITNGLEVEVVSGENAVKIQLVHAIVVGK